MTSFSQVTARVFSVTPLKLQSFDGLVDNSCMEDLEKKGGLLSKVTPQGAIPFDKKHIHF